MNKVSICTLAPQGPLVAEVVELLRRGIRERAGIVAVCAGESAADIVLDIRGGIGAEGFRVEGEPGQPVRITGNDERGLLYGVGRFLRDSRIKAGDFVPGTWRGISVPVKPVRGIYFATHFHNWYHVAPLEDVIRYVEELALWGCNALVVWFDMAIYSGVGDPAAQKMIQRLHAILAAAQRVGIRPGLLCLANEGFSTTPAPLRATNVVQNGYFAEPCGFYGVEVCPNEPGGMELILQRRTEVLDAFAGIQFEYFVIWPYDQGGCTCAKCAPWGSKGYLKTAEEVARLARARFPVAKIVLSTWYFDRFIKGEWDELQAAFATHKPAWVDYLMMDGYGSFPEYPLKHGVPGGFPALNFAEISMATMFPWGGYGANPLPRRQQSDYRKTKHLIGGGFPYSEGIYEDINKVLQLQLGWAPDREADDIVREYAAAHFDPDQAGEFVEVVGLMDELAGLGMKDTPEGLRFAHWNPPAKAEACFELVNRIDGKLPVAVRQSWRWRIVWLRAAIDAELKRTDGKPSDQVAAYFDELTEIYHAHNAVGACQPPQLKAGAKHEINAAVQAG